MKLTTKDLTKIGVFGALTIVLGLTPLGMIPIGPVRVTTLHIPTIVAALVAAVVADLPFWGRDRFCLAECPQVQL